MENKICTVCKKRFTRQWNLDRHLKTIHNISNYGENDILNEKMIGLCIHLYTLLRTSLFRNSDNQMNEMNHYPNTPQNHNFT